MAKPLSEILKKKKPETFDASTGKEPGVDFAAVSKGERDFVASHKVEKTDDVAGNGDDVYKGTTDQSTDDRHGHTPDPKAKNKYLSNNKDRKKEI